MARPLAVRWGAHELPELHAGSLEDRASRARERGRRRRGAATASPSRTTGSTSSATRSSGTGCGPGVEAEPGTGAAVDLLVRSPIPPGRYRLSIDLVDESRFWFGELGEPTLDFDVDVLPREGAGVASLGDAIPAPDWQERVLAAHREGYAVVGGSVEGRRLPAELAPYGSSRARAGLLAPARVPLGARRCRRRLDGGRRDCPRPSRSTASPRSTTVGIRVRLPSGRRRG